ncbi:MAG: hypothetical protein J5531_10305 [Lachnospiraceae bacterium]|nr:hypothetical protein [Lachnospiraceae bacterium]
MKKSMIPGIVYAALTVALGVILITLGVKEAGVDTSVPENEAVFDHMMLTVPGIVMILCAPLFVLREKLFRSTARFLFGIAGLVLLAGIILEIVYFQFIYFGLRRPQYKLVFGAFLIMLVYAVAIFVVSAVFELTRKAVQKATGGSK